MSLYEIHKPFMDAQVDNGLGDSITYKIDGRSVESSPGIFTVSGFLNEFADDGGGIGLGNTVQAIAQRWQLKIRKDALPVRPSMRHIVLSPLLDGPYRPASNNLIDNGAYWIIDLQKAPA